MRRTRRRELLAGLAAAGLTGLAGCSALGLDFDVDPERPATPTVRTVGGTPTPSGPEIPSRPVEFRNATTREAYLTVVVTEVVDGGRTTGERRGGGDTDRDAGDASGDGAAGREREAFVRSARLQPGQRRVFTGAVSHAGDYRVVVDTADGRRAVSEWVVEGTEDGLEVVVDGDVEVWPTVDCRANCSVAAAVRSDEDLPIAGDGSRQWYSPAGLVLRNPGAASAVDVTVRLYGGAILDATYEVPAGAQIRIPVTFRSGRYEVAVATDGGPGRTARWYVPHEPARYVTLGESGDVSFGCGPANTVARLHNGDDRAHRLDLAVRPPGDETPRFASTVELAPGERRTIEPVSSSGRYLLTAGTAAGESIRAVWWACPAHAAVDVRIGGDGEVGVDQDYRAYVADPERYPWSRTG